VKNRKTDFSVLIA